MKTLLLARVALLELAGVAAICIGLAIIVGAGAVLIAAGVAALVKAFELDLTGSDDSDGG